MCASCRTSPGVDADAVANDMAVELCFETFENGDETFVLPQFRPVTVARRQLT